MAADVPQLDGSIEVSVIVVRAFVRLRPDARPYHVDLARKLDEMEEKFDFPVRGSSTPSAPSWRRQRLRREGGSGTETGSQPK